MHILPNISRSKCNQKMKFGQGIEYSQINIFLQKSCRKEARKTTSGPPSVFLKILYEVEANCLQLSFNINTYWTWYTMKTNCIKLYTIDPDVCSIFSFLTNLWVECQMLDDCRLPSSICPTWKANNTVYWILSKNRTEMLKEYF